MRMMILAALLLFFSACGMMNSKDMVLQSSQALELRSYQTKTYDYDKKLVAKACIAVLQDLSFVIDNADLEVGTIGATKLDKGASMKMTLVIRQTGQKQSNVRANAQISGFGQMPQAVEDAEVYNIFFSALDKAVFLENEGL